METKCWESPRKPLVKLGEEMMRNTRTGQRIKIPSFFSPCRSDVVSECPKNVYSMKDRGTQRN